MRLTLVLLAILNLAILLLVLPPKALYAGGAEHSHWIRAERELVESGQLVIQPSDPSKRETRGWLMQELAPDLLVGRREVFRELAVLLSAQTVVFAVLAWFAPPIKRRPITAPPITPA
ncbi:MAG: hypothetical protein U0625_06920 [Phycisphaerales bacterium]